MGANLYYFSATGNSLFAGKALLKRIPNCTLESIVKNRGNRVVHPDSAAVGSSFRYISAGCQPRSNRLSAKWISAESIIFSSPQTSLKMLRRVRSRRKLTLF